MKKIFILILITFISGCASSSQDATIGIYPRVTPSNIGAGTVLSITVDDSRSSGVIGTYGDGGQIATSQDLAETIGTVLVDSFSKQGFAVGSASNQNATRIMVSLEELSYTRDGNTLSTDVETKSRVRVEAVGKSFIRTYTNSESRTIPFGSNADSNNSQLSNTLSTMIEKIVNDGELLAALKR